MDKNEISNTLTLTYTHIKKQYRCLKFEDIPDSEIDFYKHHTNPQFPIIFNTMEKLDEPIIIELNYSINNEQIEIKTFSSHKMFKATWNFNMTPSVLPLMKDKINHFTYDPKYDEPLIFFESVTHI